MAKKTKESAVEIIKTGEHTQIRITSFQYDGEDEVHVGIRKFYNTKNDKTWKPARQGMTVPLELAKKLRIKLKTISELAEEGEGIEVIKKGKRGED